MPLSRVQVLPALLVYFQRIRHLLAGVFGYLILTEIGPKTVTISPPSLPQTDVSRSAVG